MTTDPQPLPEFVFGALSTPEGRAARARSERLGFCHDLVSQPIDPRPGAPVRLVARAGAGVNLAAATVHYTVDGTQPVPSGQDGATCSVTMTRTGLAWDTLHWGCVEEWAAEIPGQPAGTRVRYSISGLTSAGEQIFSPHVDLQAAALRENPAAFDRSYLRRLTRDPAPKVYEFHVDDECPPDWLRDAVIYQIFVDRFAPNPGDDFAAPGDLAGFHGGTLQGIVSRLDYLAELGVTCLWLTPIFPSPSHHGYDPTDYDAVEPRLGSAADFRALVAAAHERGIRILLDFVANHMSSRHPAFVAAQGDAASPFRAWFYFGATPEQYECFYDVPDQPVLNTDMPAVRDYLIGCAVRWLERGCDGFRLDHAHGVTYGFWSAFRAHTRKVRPASATIGEITDTPTTVRSFAGRMDGCLDFRLLELLRAFFAFDTLSPSQFDLALRQHFAYFGAALVLPSFLDNHDMNRFLWTARGDKAKLKLAALCQFTLPGPPVIYYGTEVGLSQARALGRLEEARQPMPWGDGQDRALLAFYRRLVALRRETTPVWALPRQTLLVDDARGLYGYRCGEYAVLLNNGRSSVEIPVPEGKGAALLLATEQAATLENGGTLHLPAVAGAVIRLTPG
jgi:glycosidase